MQLNPIRKAARSQPFQPFQINLINGTSFKVPRWEQIVVGDNQVVRILNKGGIEFYHEDVITSLEFLPCPSSNSVNP